MDRSFKGRVSLVKRIEDCPIQATDVWTKDPIEKKGNLPGIEKITFLGIEDMGDLSDMDGLKEVRIVESNVEIDTEKIPIGLEKLDLYNSLITSISGSPRMVGIKEISMDHDNVWMQDGFGIEERDGDVLERMVAFPTLEEIIVTAGNEPPVCLSKKKIYGDFAKMIFCHANEPEVGCERMWVEITGKDGKKFTGELDNRPVVVDMDYRDDVTFEGKNVINIVTKEEVAKMKVKESTDTTECISEGSNDLEIPPEIMG